MTNIFHFTVNVSVFKQIFPAESTFRKFQKVSAETYKNIFLFSHRNIHTHTLKITSFFINTIKYTIRIFIITFFYNVISLTFAHNYSHFVRLLSDNCPK